MCGIVGIIDKKGNLTVQPIISKMNQAITSRGPSGYGEHVFENIAFGHRRLSIIDLEGGKQPMSDSSGKYWITYNGELYNYKILRKELQEKGVDFKTDSDTEVILYAYIHWGESCLKKFRGMFAFGILNQEDKTIFIARDPFGIKPLCYYISDTYFAFSSEIRAFRTIPDFDKTISIEALDMYLWLQYIPAPHTIFKHVKKLQPGFCMLVSSEGKVIYNKSFNTFEFNPVKGKSENDWLEELDIKFKESVKAHLMSDVPFGAFLSGGVDSTSVVSMMAQEMSHPVKTFSIGFKEEEFSELPFARKVAQKWGTDHHEQIVEPDALGILPDLVKHYGEPFGDSSAVPTYYVSKLAASHVPMVLSGDGGDEAFAGYGSHVNWMKEISKPDWVEKLPLLQRKMYPFLNTLFPNKYPITWKAPVFDIWIKYVQYLDNDWRSKLWKKEYKPELQPKYSEIESLFDEGLRFGGANTVQYFDLKTYLPNDILPKVDIASMMHGLEVRTPFIDMEMWKLALTIPEEFNIRKVNNTHWEGKILLKKWLERHFDKSFIYRSKMGFGVPLKFWFGEGGLYRKKLETILLAPDARINQFFETKEIQRLIETEMRSMFGCFYF